MEKEKNLNWAATTHFGPSPLTRAQPTPLTRRHAGPTGSLSSLSRALSPSHRHAGPPRQARLQQFARTRRQESARQSRASAARSASSPAEISAAAPLGLTLPLYSPVAVLARHQNPEAHRAQREELGAAAEPRLDCRSDLGDRPRRKPGARGCSSRLRLGGIVLQTAGILRRSWRSAAGPLRAVARCSCFATVGKNYSSVFAIP
jgi:hypothetical protein